MDKFEQVRRKAEALRDETFRDFWTLVVESASILREISPGRRRLWLAEVLEELRNEQDGKCALCGQRLESAAFQVDHKIPFCYGGGHERNNIQLAHPECNLAKRAAVDPRDLLRYLEDRYMNLTQR